MNRGGFYTSSLDWINNKYGNIKYKNMTINTFNMQQHSYYAMKE